MFKGTEPKKKFDKVFFKIVEGSIRRKVDEGTEGAVVRKWNAGGKSGTSHEVVLDSLFGRIVGLDFYDGEYEGSKYTTLNITLEDDEGEKAVLGVGVTSKYAMDIMQKLPNIDLNEAVKIRPYSFTPDGEEKEKIGVEILQRDPVTGNFTEKKSSYFHKWDGKRSTLQNGFPDRDKPYDEQTTGEREIYKITRREFLVNYIKTKVAPKLAEVTSDGEYPVGPTDMPPF